MALALDRLTHVGLCVTDLDRSLRYYRDLLGFVEDRDLRVEGEPADRLLRLRGTKLHAVYLVRDGVCIELLHFTSPAPASRPERPMNQPGLTHLSFRVADLDGVLEGLRAAGERILEDTVLRFPEIPAGAAFVLDPDGQLIELVQSPAS